MARLTVVLGAVLLFLPQWVQAQECVPSCRDGYDCISGECVQACNPACPVGSQCIDGVRCTEAVRDCNPPCPAGTVCVAGTHCASACSPACREGFVCQQGECVEVGTPPPTPTYRTLSDFPEDIGRPTRQHPMPNQVKLLLGFGGTADLETEGISGEDDLQLTIGMGLQHDFPAARGDFGLSIGTLLEILWWNTDEAADADIGRSILLDFDLVLKGFARATEQIWLYIGVPGGLTLSFINSDLVPDGVDADTAVGFNVGGVLGVQVELGTAGFFAEGSYAVHRFTHTLSSDLVPGDVDFETTIRQAGLNLGLVF